MSEPIDFYFDFSSPYSYIASELIDGVAGKYGRQVKWRPIMLGPVLQNTGAPLLLAVPLKGDYSRHDFDRSARFHGLPYTYPAKFPATTLAAARAFYWLQDQDGTLARNFAHAVFRAYWAQGLDVADLAVVQQLAAGLGIDPAALAEAVARAEVKERLKVETAGAIARRVFGAPFFFVDDEPFWGADRLPQIEKWLQNGGF